MPGLTAKQQRFVDEYLIDLNATAAARRAGYSEHTAGSIGHENLTKPEIAGAIAAAREERRRRLQMSADEVLERLTLLARAEAPSYVEWGPEGVRLRDSGTLTPEQAYAVAEVSQTAGGLRFKLHDKAAALRDLGRHHGLFVDRQELTGAGGEPIRFVEVVTPEGDDAPPDGDDA